MNLKDLLKQTASNHNDFNAMMEENLFQKLQQFALQNEGKGWTEYEACQKMLEEILLDSAGALADTLLNKS